MKSCLAVFGAERIANDLKVKRKIVDIWIKMVFDGVPEKRDHWFNEPVFFHPIKRSLSQTEKLRM